MEMWGMFGARGVWVFLVGRKVGVVDGCFSPEANVSLKKKCLTIVAPLIGASMSFDSVSTQKTKSISIGGFASELRRLLTTFDPCLEVPVKTREPIPRLLIPAEGGTHQKGQHA